MRDYRFAVLYQRPSPKEHMWSHHKLKIGNYLCSEFEAQWFELQLDLLYRIYSIRPLVFFNDAENETKIRALFKEQSFFIFQPEKGYRQRFVSAINFLSRDKGNFILINSRNYTLEESDFTGLDKLALIDGVALGICDHFFFRLIFASSQVNKYFLEDSLSFEKRTALDFFAKKPGRLKILSASLKNEIKYEILYKRKWLDRLSLNYKNIDCRRLYETLDLLETYES